MSRYDELTPKAKKGLSCLSVKILKLIVFKNRLLMTYTTRTVDIMVKDMNQHHAAYLRAKTRIKMNLPQYIINSRLT